MPHVIKIDTAERIIKNISFNSSPYADTGEGKLMTSILYSAIQDLLKGTRERKKAASKWLYHCKNNELRNICLIVVGIDLPKLNKLLIEKVGETKFNALYELGKSRLRVEKNEMSFNTGRKKIQGVKRTASGIISRAKGVKPGPKLKENIKRLPSGKIYKYIKKGRKRKEGVLRLPSGRISRAKGTKRGRPPKLKGDDNE